VVTLGDTTRPYVDVFVPQGELAGLRDGTKATVRVDGTARTWTGVVESVGRTLEFTPRFLFSDKERPNLVVRVRVDVADPGQRLHAGIPAFVTFEREAP
jgi:HlyD family secretion protein